MAGPTGPVPPALVCTYCHWVCLCMCLYIYLSVCLCVSLVRRYDEMADKLSGHPEDTEALVNLQLFLNNVSICILSTATYYQVKVEV